MRRVSDDPDAVLGRLVLGGPGPGHCGVVDEDVDAAMLTECGLDELPPVGLVGDVTGYNEGAAHLLGQGFEEVGAAGGEDGGRAGRGHRPDECGAKAFGGAGDDDDLAGQVGHRVSS